MGKRKILKIYFSPTGTAKKTVDTVAGELGGDGDALDLLRHREIGTDCGSYDLAVVGMPVYGGRIPEICAKALSKLEGKGIPAIATVVYGNRAFEDALIELRDVLEESGFAVIGAAAFIAQHSIFPASGRGRPDAQDLARMADFARRCDERLDGFDPKAPDLTTRTPLKVSGNRPYRKLPGSLPLSPPSKSSGCDDCGACAAVCPTGALKPNAPGKADPALCIRCAACVAACPKKVRKFRGLKYYLIGKLFSKKFSARREPEIFVE